MSSSAVVQLSGVGKEYVLGERAGISSLRGLFSGRRGPEEPSRWRRDRIWALRDASCEIERGEAVGVIGHNGAGKTTMLKLLSRITAPTTGEIRITGNVGSLLEVGTGFHPELTGRDNVFLNGAILGMRRREIVGKFDEIVEFAGVERFIDTPVKRYSSGMYVRLAFAVAAHLEPDILIVDEVLAVGDAAFQSKCLGKMGEVSGEGRTVLFVSHNMAAVRTLTQRAVWLDHGSVVQIGRTSDVVPAYLDAVSESTQAATIDLTDDRFRRNVGKPLAHQVRFESVSLVRDDGGSGARIPEGVPLRLAIAFSVYERVRFLELVALVKTHDGTRLFASFSGQRDDYVEPGRYEVQCEFPETRLRPFHYTVELQARAGQIQDIVPAALVFEVEQGHRELENPAHAMRADGVMNVPSQWSEVVAVEVGPSAPALRA